MKKKILFISLFLLLLIAIPVTVFLVKQRQEIRQRAVAATSLYFEPSTETKNVGETFTLNLKVDTASNYIAAAQVQITYSAGFLELQSIQPGTFLPNILSEPVIDNDQGIATFTYAYQGGEGLPGGANGNQQTIATFTFKALQATAADTPVQIEIPRPPTKVVAGTFVPGTDVSVDPDKGTDVLIAASGATVTINSSGQASPSPSATPGTQASPSPTPGTNPTPTASPTQVTRITAPANGATITNTRRPVIRGVSFDDALVILSVSLNQTNVIEQNIWADANGDWSYTPTSDLANGTYSILVTAEDRQGTGTTERATSTFTINYGGTGGPNPTPTPTPTSTPGASASPGTSAIPSPTVSTVTETTETKGGIPETGTITQTLLLITLALLLVLFGSSAILIK